MVIIKQKKLYKNYIKNYINFLYVNLSKFLYVNLSKNLYVNLYKKYI
jgi:hypothetical protein